MDFKLLAEKKLTEMSSAKAALLRTWRPYVDAINKKLQVKEGRKMSTQEEVMVAQVLENSFTDGVKRAQINETTYASDIAFLGVNELCVA